ncbi:MAG: hypothetical protein ACK4JY_13820 [Brevundimonas sp.]|uniref:hypothetical protein n=1 Tax=Brevundimonas sp. TaxID=1871086 RepID=UPI00391CCC96
MPAKPRPHSPEDDLAFMRSIVEGGRPQLTLGVAYLAGGLLYGLQCLFHVGQSTGVIRWPDLANLAFVVLITGSFCAVLTWAVLKDRRDGMDAARGPMAGRALNAAFSASGMANLAVILIFGFGAARDGDFAIWLYYPAVIFALQAAAWYVAFSLKRKPWMLACSVGGWFTAVALGLLVRQPDWYLAVCTVALFALFALPGWIMVRDARAARTRG